MDLEEKKIYVELQPITRVQAMCHSLVSSISIKLLKQLQLSFLNLPKTNSIPIVAFRDMLLRYFA